MSGWDVGVCRFQKGHHQRYEVAENIGYLCGEFGSGFEKSSTGARVVVQIGRLR